MKTVNAEESADVRETILATGQRLMAGRVIRFFSQRRGMIAWANSLFDPGPL
jgi:hypothetical protein